MNETAKPETAKTETTTAVAQVPQGQRMPLIQKFAQRYAIDPNKLMGILKATCFKVKDKEASPEQMVALLVVADQYGLNPFTREIFAFPDKQNGIVPVVGVDGWSRIINDHEQGDGFEFRESEKMVTMTDAKPCPEWMEVVIYRKDRSHPTVVREYIDEVYKPLGSYPDGNRHQPGPWQTHTKRFLRHKTLIQGARIAFGFSGIYDEDEASRIMSIDVTPVQPQLTERSGTERLKTAIAKANGGAAEPTEDVGDLGAGGNKYPTGDGVTDVVSAQMAAEERQAETVNKETGEVTGAQRTATEVVQDKAATQSTNGVILLHDGKPATIVDFIAALDKHVDLDAMAQWADQLDNSIKTDARFTKAYRKAMDRIKAKK